MNAEESIASAKAYFIDLIDLNLAEGLILYRAMVA